MDGPVNSFPLQGWIPFRLYWQDSEPGVEWLYMGANGFPDPFFEATMHFEAHTPFNSLFRFRTPLAALADWHVASPGLKPAGFIFHLSRCGSTLITRMLAALPQNLVLSEPGLLERMLRCGQRAPHSSTAQRVAWLQWLVSALGQPRAGLEQRLFIKFDPGNIVDLPLLRQAFPGVPWIFVYRDPVEVMVSNLRAPARILAKGILPPESLNLNESVLAAMDDAEYSARVLGFIAESASHQAVLTGGKLIEYKQLPSIVWRDLRQHFQLDFTPDEIDQLQRVAAFDAKEPKRRFETDAEAKNREATPHIRYLAEQWIAPHYKRLEEIRHSQATGFPAFRKFLLDNPPALDRLRGLDRQAFMDAALRLASEAGIHLDRSGIEQAMLVARTQRMHRLL